MSAPPKRAEGDWWFEERAMIQSKQLVKGMFGLTGEDVGEFIYNGMVYINYNSFSCKRLKRRYIGLKVNRLKKKSSGIGVHCGS